MIIAAKNRKFFINFDHIKTFYIQKAMDDTFGLIAYDGSREYWLGYFYSDKDILPVIIDIINANHLQQLIFWL